MASTKRVAMASKLSAKQPPRKKESKRGQMTKRSLEFGVTESSSVDVLHGPMSFHIRDAFSKRLRGLDRT